MTPEEQILLRDLHNLTMEYLHFSQEMDKHVNFDNFVDFLLVEQEMRQEEAEENHREEEQEKQNIQNAWPYLVIYYRI